MSRSWSSFHKSVVLAALTITASSSAAAQQQQPSRQQDIQGRTARISTGEVGQRQERTDVAEIIQPTGRIENRLQTRIPLRMQTRIDRTSDPEEQRSAEARIRTAAQTGQQTPP